MEIGERLKEARLQKDISLDHLQETTKIQKRYLVAIEEGKFDILPGKFYARAFIKEYANAVGLDPNELLEEFKEKAPPTEEADTAQYTRIQRSKKENSSTKTPAFFSLLPTIIVILLVIGIVFAGWYFYKEALSGDDDNTDSADDSDNEEIIDFSDDEQNDNHAEEEEDDDDDDNEEDADKDSDKDKGDKDKKPKISTVEEGTGNSPESTVDLKNAGDDIKIKLKAKKETYVSMKNADEKSYYEGEMTSDDSSEEYDISDDDRIYLNVGNVPGLKVTINGTEVKFPVDNDQFVHQKLWINLTSYDD